MTKTLEFVSIVILFFLSISYSKAVPRIPNRKCEVVKDCYDAFNFDAEDLEFIKSTGKQVVCENGLCRFIPF
jgi:hypothetical protein